MADASRELQIVISAKDEASKVVKSFGQKFKDLADDARLGSAAIIGALSLVGKNMIDVGMDIEQARISFDTMFGSVEKGGKIFKQVSDFAVKTPFSLPQVVEGTKRLAAYGIEAENIIPTFKMLGDITSAVGTDKLPQLILAFGQVRSATRLTGAELRQFSEAGVPLLKVLAEQAGTTEAAMSELISEKAVGFEDVRRALQSLTEEGGRFYKLSEKQAGSLGGVIRNTADEFIRFSAAVLGFTDEGDVRKGSIFYYLKQGAEALLITLQKIRPAVQGIVDILVQNQVVIFAVLGGLLALLIPLVIAFWGLIAPALAFLAAGVAIGAAVGLLVQQFGGLNSVISQLQAGWQFLADLFNSQVLPFFQMLANVLMPIVNDAMVRMGPSLQRLGQALQELAIALAPVIELLLKLLAAILMVVAAILTSFIAGVINALPALIDAFTGFIQIITGILNVLVGIFTLNGQQILLGWQQVFGGIQLTTVSILSAILAYIGGFWGAVIGLFTSLAQTVLGIILPFLTRLYQGFKLHVDMIISIVTFLKNTVLGIINAFAAGWEAAMSRVKGAIDAVVGAINNLISKAREMAGAIAGGLKIPGFQHGGFIPGAFSEAVPAILHGGERIIPRNGVDVNPGSPSGGGVTINFSGPVSMDSESRVQDLADRIIQVLGRQNELAAKGLSI